MVVVEVRELKAHPVQQGEIADEPDQADHDEGRQAPDEAQDGAEPGEEGHTPAGLAEADLFVGGAAPALERQTHGDGNPIG